MHSEGEARIDTHEDVAKNELAIAADAHADNRLVAHAVTESIRGCHVNVAQSANHSLIQFHAAAGFTFERAAGGIGDVTALANGRLDAELELLGHRDFDLGVFARRPEHAHALD